VTAPTTPAELLEAAARRILANGHYKGSFIDYSFPRPKTAPCCAIGAIRLSAGLSIDQLERAQAVHPQIVRDAEETLGALIIRVTGRECVTEDELTDYVETIATWNDAPNNGAASVVDMLYDAAEMAR
jgi:hypothetical protein